MTVYVVQNDGSKDVRQALKHSLRVQTVFDHPMYPDEVASRDWVGMARDRLQEFSHADDFLLLIGDPALIALCVRHLSRSSGILRLLRYDRKTRGYFEICFPA